MFRNLPICNLKLKGPKNVVDKRLCSFSRAKKKDFRESLSFVKGLFNGKINIGSIYPFPQVLNDEQKDTLKMLVDPTLKFFHEVNDPAVNDREAKITDKVMKGLKEMGAFGLQIPTKYGGLGLNNTQYAKMVELVGSGQDMGVGITLGAHQSIGFKAILLYGTEEQKAKYLPKLATGENIAAFCLTEPASGSDAASIRTVARPFKTKDGKLIYKLSGSKIWISNGGLAEIFTVFARILPGEGRASESEHKDSYKDIGAFIVERSFGGVQSGPPEHKMGIKASNTAELHFDDCEVPAANLLGQEGDGFKIAVNVLNNGRFGMGAAMSGLMGACIAKSVEFARDRVQFDGRQIWHYGAIQEKLAKMAARKYVTEAVSYALAGAMDRGDDDYALEAAICKVMASEYAWYVIDEAIQIHGGMGFMTGTGLERIMRDLRIFRIFEGTSEILKIFVALGGIQYLGSYYKNLSSCLKNPFSNYPVIMSELSRQIKRNYLPNFMLAYTSPNMFPTHIKADNQNPVSSAHFSVCTKIWLSNFQSFAKLVQSYALKIGPHTRTDPFTFDEFGLIRLADCATLLYSGAVGLSRALLPGGTAHEMSLMRVYIDEADEIITNHLRTLKLNQMSSKFSTQTGQSSTRFDLIKQVTKEMISHDEADSGNPLIKHPLGI